MNAQMQHLYKYLHCWCQLFAAFQRRKVERSYFRSYHESMLNIYRPKKKGSQVYGFCKTMRKTRCSGFQLNQDCLVKLFPCQTKDNWLPVNRASNLHTQVKTQIIHKVQFSSHRFDAWMAIILTTKYTLRTRAYSAYGINTNSLLGQNQFDLLRLKNSNEQ